MLWVGQPGRLDQHGVEAAAALHSRADGAEGAEDVAWHHTAEQSSSIRLWRALYATL
jgi:hypothetical protein